jgi:alpha-tubulin suppressor-like RCC1 family protein
MLYTFGSGAYGRLGHGDHHHQHQPTLVATLKDKFILQAACGGMYTIALASKQFLLNFAPNRLLSIDNGTLYSWGSNR